MPMNIANDPWKPIPFSKLREVCGRPEVQWVWENLLAIGHITDFYALWKSGKTTLVAALLKHMESGGELAGKKVFPGKALVVTEEPPELWMERGEELDWGDHVHFIFPLFWKRPTESEWSQFISYLQEAVSQNGYRLVVFDALPSLWPVEDENDAGKVLLALTPFRRLAEAGCAVLLVRHPRKSDGKEGTAGRGSGAISGFVDFILEMRRYRPEDARDTRRVLTVYSRYGPFEVVIRWNGGADYEVLGSPEDFSAQQQQQQLFDALAELGEATTDALAQIIGIPRSTAHKRLSELLKAGRVVSLGSGKRGDPKRWALAGKAEFLSPHIERDRGEKNLEPPGPENREVSSDLSGEERTKENKSGDGSGGNISPQVLPHFATPESSKERYVTPTSPGEAMGKFFSPHIEKDRGGRESREGEAPDFYPPRIRHEEQRGGKESEEGDSSHFYPPRALSICGGKESPASPGEAPDFRLPHSLSTGGEQKSPPSSGEAMGLPSASNRFPPARGPP